MDTLAFTALWMAYCPHGATAAARRDNFPSRDNSQCLRINLLTIVVASILGASSWGLPAQANWGRVVYVNTPQGYALNVRWGPGTNYGVYRKVLRGTSLPLTGVRRNGWLQLTDGTWVAGNLVSSGPVDGAGGSTSSRNIAYVVTPSNLALNIRSGPGSNYARVGQFLNGTRIRLSGRYNAGWAELADGNWVDNSFLRTSYPDNQRPDPNPPPQYDPNVADLQRRLIQLGFLSPGFVVSGIYDLTTQEAVREFQRVNGLPADGVVDAATWRVLYEATSPNPLPTPTPTPTPTVNPTPSPTGNQARVVTDGEDALVFAGPDPSTEILRTVPNGATVFTTGRITGNWTELADGGWVFTPYLDSL